MPGKALTSLVNIVVGLGLALALATAGCHADRARPAPFRVRPDSVDGGDLRGPFEGRVVDASSGDGVAGALVYATWTFERGLGATEPAGFRDAVSSTDASGRYVIATLEGVPSGARVTDFQLVVYKRGYVAYRSNRRFEDFGPRLDFAQKQNRVALDRWRADFSHARHLRYVGGGAALAALTRWEVPLAASELGAAHAGPRVATDLVVADRLVAAQLLGESDLTSITGFEGRFETGPLNDDPDTASYSSQHFKALEQPETFDVALRLWRMPADDADSRYRELLDGLPGAEARDEIADRSLRASERQIFGVGFLDKSRGVVVLLTCGEAQCKTIDTAVALARKAYDRLKAIAPTAPAPTTPPTPPTPPTLPKGKEQP